MTRELNVAATNLEVLKEQLDTQQVASEQLSDSLAKFDASSTNSKQQLADLQKRLADTVRQNQTLANKISALEKWRKAAQSTT